MEYEQQNNLVTQEEYEQALAGRLDPEAMDTGEIVTERIKLGGLGAFATDRWVRIMRVYDRDGYFKIPIQLISEDGQTNAADVEAPKVTRDGIILSSDTNTADIERGYFLNADGDLESELRLVEEQLKAPVRSRPIEASPPAYYEAA